MDSNLNLIVMLTHNDQTVPNAYEIFKQCENCKAQYWGMKEKGLPLPEMKKLYSYMKECQKTTVMEVVAYTEDECLNGAKLAAECGCDILMGTLFFDSVNEFCKANNLKYMPFIGNVYDRPSVLEGSVDEMVDAANTYLQKGVYGFDLLGYRYQGDADSLIFEFVSRVDAPVCVAGSINSFERLDLVKQSKAWAFTVGGAFFENDFNGSFAQQIDKVIDYISQKS